MNYLFQLWNSYDIRIPEQGLSEWLLLNTNSAILYTISWREQVNFQWNYDKVRFVLDQLDFYSSNSLKQQSVGRHVAPLGHIILIPSQPVFALSP